MRTIDWIQCKSTISDSFSLFRRAPFRDASLSKLAGKMVDQTYEFNMSILYTLFSKDELENFIINNLYCIVSYCVEGVVIDARCTANFSRSIVLPRI